MYRYTNNLGQVIDSDELLPKLDKLARWTRTEIPTDFGGLTAFADSPIKNDDTREAEAAAEAEAAGWHVGDEVEFLGGVGVIRSFRMEPDPNPLRPAVVVALVENSDGTIGGVIRLHQLVAIPKDVVGAPVTPEEAATLPPAIVTQPDGTVVGDGETIAMLQPTAEDGPAPIAPDSQEAPETAPLGGSLDISANDSIAAPETDPRG